MPVDRGGLEYPINVTYDDSGIADFRSDILNLRADIAFLKRDLQGVSLQGSVGGIGGAGGNILNSGNTTNNINITKTSSSIQSLKPAIDSVNVSANTLAGTFERLFTRVIIIGAIRKVASEFGAFVGEMVNFNSSLEKATLGISSLLLALGDIKDAAGNDTNTVRGFALAQAEAAKQTAQLRVDALSTASTFEELTKVFQTTIAPGLQAGLNIDQIREFSVQITRAATAINIPINELGAQIRAILGGTINNRNTTIARALGISNEDIKNAKELGDIYGFLQGKLSAFTTSGQASLSTFDVILTNTKDAFAQVIGSGGLQFFNTLKTLFHDIQQSLVTINPLTGNLEPNPKAVTAVKFIADSLTLALNQVRKLGDEFVFDDLIKGADLFGRALSITFDLLTAIIQGGIRGGKDLVQIFDVLYEAAAGLNEEFKALTGIDLFKDASLTSALAKLVEIAVVLKGISLTVSTISGLVGLLTSPVIGILAAVYLIGEGTRSWLSNLSGVDLKYSTIFKTIAESLQVIVPVLGDQFSGLFDRLVIRAKIGFGQIYDIGKTGFDDLVAYLQDKFDLFIQFNINAINTILGVFGKAPIFTDYAAKAKVASDAIQKINFYAHQQRIAQLDIEADKVESNFQAEVEATQKAREAVNGIIKENLAQNGSNPDIGTLIRNALASARTAISGAGVGLSGPGVQLGSVPDNLKEANQELGLFSKSFENLPGIISPTLESFKAQVKTMHDLQEAAVKANAALKEGLQVLLLTGPVLTERKNLFDAENQQRELSKILLVDEKNIQAALTGILAQQAALETEIKGLNEDQRDILFENVEPQQAVLNLLNLLGAATIKQQQLEDQKNTAAKKGDTQAIQDITVKIVKHKEYTDALQGEIESINKLADASVKDQSPADAKKIVDLAAQRVLLQGKEVVFENLLKQIGKDKLDIELQVNRAASDKNTLLAKQNTLEVQNQNAILAIQAANARANFNTRFSLPEVTSLVQLQGALTLLQEQVAQAQKQRQLAIDQISLIIQQTQALLVKAKAEALSTQDSERRKQLLLDITAFETTLNANLAYRNVLQDQNNLKLKEENVQLEKAAENAQHAKDIIEKPISTGFIDGIRKAAQELPSLYQGTVDVIKNIVTGLTDFISTSIVDAFDPTKKEDITARFAQFLQGIAKQVLDMFIHLAIVKAVLGLGFLGDGGVPGGGLPSIGSFGLANGGAVPQQIGLPGQGFATGGLIGRPTNLDPRDTKPIWTQPGEFVQPLSSVRQYGADVMERLQKGLINPSSLRALSLGRVDRTGPSNSGAFASAISSGARNQSGSARNIPQTAQPSVPQPSYIVANDQALDKLLSGGKNAMFNFFTENKGRLRGIIGS